MKAAVYSFMKIETIVIDLLQFSTKKKFDLKYMHEDIFTQTQRLVLRKQKQKTKTR